MFDTLITAYSIGNAKPQAADEIFLFQSESKTLGFLDERAVTVSIFFNYLVAMVGRADTVVWS